MSDAASTPQTAGPVGDFAKKTMEALTALAPEKRDEIRGIVTSLATTYGREGQEAAEKKFEEHFRTFDAVAQAKKAMDSLDATEGAAKTGIHHKVADTVGGLNPAKAELLAGLLQNAPVIQNIPGAGMFGKALQSAANIELNVRGLTGQEQVFKAISETIRKVGERLEQVLGKDLSLGTAQGLLSSIGGKVREGVNDLADKAAGSNLGAVASIGAALKDAMGKGGSANDEPAPAAPRQGNGGIGR